jgi:hypothetical protein
VFYGHHASRECTTLHNISSVFLWIFLLVNPKLHGTPGRARLFPGVVPSGRGDF